MGAWVFQIQIELREESRSVRASVQLRDGSTVEHAASSLDDAVRGLLERTKEAVTHPEQIAEWRNG